MKKMSKNINSADLTNQLAKVLGLGEGDKSGLYGELCAMPNGHVKDALHDMACRMESMGKTCVTGRTEGVMPGSGEFRDIIQICSTSRGLSNELAARRQARCLSKADAGSLIGETAGWVEKLEDTRHDFDLSTSSLLKYMMALGISIGDSVRILYKAKLMPGSRYEWADFSIVLNCLCTSQAAPASVNPSKTIRIRYLDDTIERLHYIGGKSDWIDLRAAGDVELKAGSSALIHLGVAMQLPAGYEAHIVPRSSTFKNFGILQTNHCGIIDESYCGNDDWWYMPVYATRDTKINKNDRICQFRIMEHQPAVMFEETASFKGGSRGGFGSTGIN